MVPLRYLIFTQEPCANGQIHERIVFKSSDTFSTLSEGLAYYQDGLDRGDIPVGSDYILRLVPTSGGQHDSSTDICDESDKPTDDLTRTVRHLQLLEQNETRFRWRLYDNAHCEREDHLLLHDSSGDEVFRTIQDCLQDFKFKCFKKAFLSVTMTLVIEACFADSIDFF